MRAKVNMMLRARPVIAISFLVHAPLEDRIEAFDRVGMSLPANVFFLAVVDGIVATNTTITRPGPLKSAAAVETGGLSGRPLHSRSVAVLRSLRAAMGPGFPIIGVGGIVSPEAGMTTRDAGADLLQLYTGLIYRGPALIRELLDIVRSSSHEHQR